MKIPVFMMSVFYSFWTDKKNTHKFDLAELVNAIIIKKKVIIFPEALNFSPKFTVYFFTQEKSLGIKLRHP